MKVLGIAGSLRRASYNRPASVVGRGARNPDNAAWLDGLRHVGSLSSTAASASAQFDAPGSGDYRHDIAYDGRFTFVRLRWRSDFGFARAAAAARRGTTTTRAPSSISRRSSSELTALDVRTDGSRILTLDDPELFRYPIALHVGAGLLESHRSRGGDRSAPTCSRAASRSSRTSTAPQQWSQLRGADAPRAARRRASSGSTTRIASSTRSSRSRTSTPSSTRCRTSARATTASSRDNDPVEAPDGRSPTSTTTCRSTGSGPAQGLFPFDASNEAYKLGVNYLIYGLTH